MSSQFAHVQTHSRKISANNKGKGSTWTISDIAAEAGRDPEHSKHVKNPKDPIPLRGDLKALNSELDDYLKVNKNTAKNGVERAARPDAHVMISNVYSWPQPVDNFDQDRFDDFGADCLKFHDKEFGICQAAVVHLDEAFPHIHAYSYSSAAKEMHPGLVAKKEAYDRTFEELKGGDVKVVRKAATKAGNEAYKVAMEDFQERFYQEVGKKHGLDRLGPKRQRLTGDEWAKQKRERLANADRMKALANEAKKMEDQVQSLESEIEPLAKEVEVLKADITVNKELKLDLSSQTATLTAQKVKDEALLVKRKEALKTTQSDVKTASEKLDKINKGVKKKAGFFNSVRSALGVESKAEKAMRLKLEETEKKARENASKWKKHVDVVEAKAEQKIKELEKDKHEHVKESRETRLKLVDKLNTKENEVVSLKADLTAEKYLTADLTTQVEKLDGTADRKAQAEALEKANSGLSDARQPKPKGHR